MAPTTREETRVPKKARIMILSMFACRHIQAQARKTGSQRRLLQLQVVVESNFWLQVYSVQNPADSETGVGMEFNDAGSQLSKGDPDLPNRL